MIYDGYLLFLIIFNNISVHIGQTVGKLGRISMQQEARYRKQVVRRLEVKHKYIATQEYISSDRGVAFS
jgi:hypothetical protein